MNINFKEIIPKTKLDVIEDITIVLVELFAPPVIDDLIEHELHSLNKTFSKKFSNKGSFLDEAKEYCNGIVDFLKEDIKLVKKISCYHHSHASILKQFIERSLIKNGFENLVQAGVVVAVGVESLPVLIASVAISQTFEYIEQKNESTIFDGIKSRISLLRKECFHSPTSTNKNKI